MTALIATAVKDCCAACQKASRTTKQPGTTPFNHPFVGRPLRDLRHNDFIRSMGPAPHHLGLVTRRGSDLLVEWDDRTYTEPLTGAIALCMLRQDELPAIPGAGLMPINGELLEMVERV